LTAKLPEPEFSWPFAVDRLGTSPVTVSIVAKPEQCARLARRLGLVAIERLAASATLRRLPGVDIIHVDGRFEADIVQTCVVTLAPFQTHVVDELEGDFGGAPEAAAEVSVAMDEDPPEPIENGVIDIGELAAQFLSLSLEPYPRSPGVALEEVWGRPDPESESPFAVLRAIRPKA